MICFNCFHEKKLHPSKGACNGCPIEFEIDGKRAIKVCLGFAGEGIVNTYYEITNAPISTVI